MSSYTLASTTLSAAITATTTSIPLASTANVSVGQKLFIDAELTGQITAVSSTAATVSRDPTSSPTSHASGATVWIGQPNQFFLGDPPMGTAVASTSPNPWVNAFDGRVWEVVNGAWERLAAPYTQMLGSASVTAAGSTQGDAATLAAGYPQVITVTGANTTKAVTLPASVAGAMLIVQNAVTNESLPIFPAAGEVINALASNTAYDLAGAKTAVLACAVGGTWFTVLTA